MTWKSLMFTDKPLVVPCLVQNEDGKNTVEAVEYETYLKGEFVTDCTRFFPGMADLGHKTGHWDMEFDHCFEFGYETEDFRIRKIHNTVYRVLL